MVKSEREKKAFAASLGPNAAAPMQETPERVAPQVFEVPDDVLNRQSLLDTRNAKRLHAGKTQSVSRVVLVGKYNVAADELTEAASSFFEGRSATDTFTGVILYYNGATYSSVAAVVLEAPMEGINAFLTSWATERFEDSRVISFSDDVARAWPVFATGSVTANSSSPDLMEESAVRSELCSIVLNCSRLGRSLREAAKASEPEQISRSLATATEWHPPALFLLSALGTNALFTVERYVGLYLSPVKLELPSEKVWPCQEVRLTY